jgi:hypothetical protein
MNRSFQRRDAPSFHRTNIFTPLSLRVFSARVSLQRNSERIGSVINDELMFEVGLIRKQRTDGWWMGLAEGKELLDQKDSIIVEDEQVIDVDVL